MVPNGDWKSFKKIVGWGLLERLQSIRSLDEKLVSIRKFYIRRNNNKVDSIETGRRVIGNLLP